MIGIINYGMGNLLSVYNAIDLLGERVRYCSHPEELSAVERVILPGVGAFRDCVKSLKENYFIEALEDFVLHKARPFFGICVGMQCLGRKSFELGEHKGLGWIDGDVIRLQPAEKNLKVPQVGWNDIKFNSKIYLFQGLPVNPDVYFVHSYYLNCDDSEVIAATCNYGMDVTAAVLKNNIFATQFHPEKSQDIGISILSNFIDWSP